MDDCPEPCTTRKCFICGEPCHRITGHDPSDDSHVFCSSLCCSRFGMSSANVTPVEDCASDGEETQDAEAKTSILSPKSRQRYSLSFKRKAILQFEAEPSISKKAFSRKIGVSSSAFIKWTNTKDEIFKSSRNLKSKSLGGGGGKSIIPPCIADSLIRFMKGSRRHDKPLTAKHLAQFVRQNHPSFFQEYVAKRLDDSLLRLLREFARRQNFVSKRSCADKHRLED